MRSGVILLAHEPDIFPQVPARVAAQARRRLRADASTGEIGGTPSSPGVSTGLQVRVTDANGTTASSQTFAIAVADPLTATAQVGPGTVGLTYAGAVAATGGRGPFTFAVSAGTLPSGLQIDAASGRIAGTPRAAGIVGGLQVRVVDADGRVALTDAFAIDIAAALGLAGLGTPTQTATVGVAYDSGVSATGGRAPYRYELVAGVLPAGLTLDADAGRIVGTPAAAGAAEGLAIGVTDAQGRTVRSGVFRIDVRDPVAVAGAPAGFGTLGTAYAPAGFAATGGRGRAFIYYSIGVEKLSGSWTNGKP
jgi:hypothetical protein